MDAGLAPAAAAARLYPGRSGRARSEVLRAALQGGKSLAAALQAAGYTTALEHTIVATAERGGRGVAALRFIADNHERRAARAAGLRARLLFPTAVLFIVLLADAVRDIAAGTAAFTAITVNALCALAAVAAARGVVASLTADPAHTLAWGWRLGGLAHSAWYRDAFEATLGTLLVWQFESGVDPVSGARDVAALIPRADFRAAAARYRRAVAAGRGIVEALDDADLLAGGELREVLRAGETAGRLDSSLRRYVALLDARRERRRAAIARWVPRVGYVIMLAIGAAFIV